MPKSLNFSKIKLELIVPYIFVCKFIPKEPCLFFALILEIPSKDHCSEITMLGFILKYIKLNGILFVNLFSNEGLD